MQVQVYVPDADEELWAKVKELAEAKKSSVSAVVVECLKTWVAMQEASLPQQVTEAREVVWAFLEEVGEANEAEIAEGTGLDQQLVTRALIAMRAQGLREVENIGRGESIVTVVKDPRYDGWWSMGVLEAS